MCDVKALIMVNDLVSSCTIKKKNSKKNYTDMNKSSAFMRLLRFGNLEVKYHNFNVLWCLHREYTQICTK